MNQPRLNVIESRFAAFAEKRIAPRADSLRTADAFPGDLWVAMGADGLFGLGLPPEAGGQGHDARAVSDAGRVLVETGGNFGIAMSWLMHEIVSRYMILRFGNPEQHRTLLPDLAAGRITAAFAVSEPGTGAHPKHLKTAAVPEGDHFRITGEKIYITNGPIADLFIVIAVTGEESGRKRFTAFLVPKSTPGLTVEPIPMNILKPAPHGRVVLDGCHVSAGQVLGPMGGAYDAMVLPFREIEDILMMGPIIGGMVFLVRRLRERTEGDAETASALFDLHIALSGLRVIAREAADMLEKGSDPGRRTELVLYARGLAAESGAKLERIMKAAEAEGVSPDPMEADLGALLRIRHNVTELLRKKQVAKWLGNT